VRKLVRPKFKRLAKEYFVLYRSRKPVRARLEKRQIDHIIRECRKGRRTSYVAEEMRISQRRVQQIWAAYRATGRPPEPQRPGRPGIRPTGEQTAAVLAAHDSMPAGVARTARYLRHRGMQISEKMVYGIMKEHGMVTPSAAKSRRRKWIRYERRYSNAMWHTDWHEMKDHRFQGYQLITYLDDASRCVVGAAVCREATSENAVAVLQASMAEFGTPATILSDNGACFVGVRRKTPTKSWTPTAFESELLDRGIELINARPYHPQTNGKLERFHRTLEEELRHFGSLSEFVAYYNEVRLHWSLDIDNGETPLQAFHNRKVPDAIRENDPKWMEKDTNDEAK